MAAVAHPGYDLASLSDDLASADLPFLEVYRDELVARAKGARGPERKQIERCLGYLWGRIREERARALTTPPSPDSLYDFRGLLEVVECAPSTASAPSFERAVRTAFPERGDEALAAFRALAAERARRLELGHPLKRWDPEDWICAARARLGEYGTLGVARFAARQRPGMRQDRLMRVRDLATAFLAASPDEQEALVLGQRQGAPRHRLLVEHAARHRISAALAAADWRAARLPLFEAGQLPLLTPWARAVELGDEEAARRASRRAKAVRRRLLRDVGQAAEDVAGRIARLRAARAARRCRRAA
ncbi:MAG TPA: hypothetical protein VNJ53_01295 [Gaiellaceae bacterium]|nr:hypothetical protein [Gaiellaceae bacterium]